MGFFNIKHGPAKKTMHMGSVDFLHKGGCKVCPLRNQHGGDMPPFGSDKPVVYMLGEAPGKMEVRKGQPFVGPAGKVLRLRVPSKWESKLRWNNCVRSRPTDPKNPDKDRTPTPVEIECCRPSVVKDIEASKPKAIFGFGNIALAWAANKSGITKWNGRYMPVKVGNHTCWFFPMIHPSYVNRSRKGRPPRNKNEYGSDIEFVFAQDMKRAFRMVKDLPDPEIHDLDTAFDGVDIVTGGKGETDVRKVINFLESMYKEPIVGMDYETNRLRPYSEGAKILTVALSGKKKTLSWPVHHSKSLWSKGQTKRVNAAFKTFLKKYKGRKLAHQLAFEMEWTAFFYGADLLHGTKWGDSISQAYILDARKGALSLDDLSFQYFGVYLKALTNVDRKNLDNTDLDHVVRYNALDAKYHRLLYIVQRKRLRADKLTKVYRHQLRRVPTLTLTQLKGLPVSQKVVSRFRRVYDKRLEKVRKKLYDQKCVKKYRQRFNKEFRVSANDDVKKLFTDILQVKLEKNREDKIAVDVKTLEKTKHPIAKLVLKWRGLEKIRSTYITPVEPNSEHLYPDGKIHPIIGTYRTTTWRTNSEDPNIQNWPKRKRREIRRIVKAPPNFRVVSFDYAGIQARNVAMESKDKKLVKEFGNHYDIHQAWMNRLIELHPKWVTDGLKSLKDKAVKKSYRHRAKNEFVFPSFFGAQPKSVAKNLGVPVDIVERLQDEFFDYFSGVKTWQDSLRDFYMRHGYVTGLSGFRRRAPVSPNELINAPIQSDEAIIVMDAMCRLSEQGDPQLQACLMVHDDLTFIWHKNDVDRYAEVVISYMLDVPFEWAKIVPLGVEMSVGRDWDQQEGVGEWFSDSWNGRMAA